MTKRDALLLCEEQWIWQGENPYDLNVVELAEYHKYNWPRLRSNGGDVPDWDDHHYCSCCKYAGFDSVIENCVRCPIPEGAWTKNNSRNTPCERPGSPYQKWRHAKTKKTRSKYAFAIAALARAELDKTVRK